MKRIFITFSLLLTGGMATADEEPSKNVRVSVQFIAMPHTVMTELLASGETDGARLHDKASALTKEGKAKMVETAVVGCRSGQKATAESTREEIYPVEVPSHTLPCGPTPTPSLVPEVEYPTKHRSYTAFATRNRGTMLEVEAKVLTDGRFVELRLVPELVSRNRLETMVEYRDRWGDASIRMPIYETWRTMTSLTVRPGQFALVSVIHPLRQQAAPFVDSRILLFVRADVLPE